MHVLNNFFTQYKHTYGQLWASHSSHMKAAHTVLYMKKHTETYAPYTAMDISCMSVQWCRSRSRGRALYRDASWAGRLRSYWARLLQGLTMPNPPRRAGRANKSRSRSLGGALPVQAGISWDLIVSSRGCIREF